jgi:hypothetical protein
MQVLLAHHRKGGWHVKGRNVREREMFKGRESSSTERLHAREGNVEGKEDIKRRKH